MKTVRVKVKSDNEVGTQEWVYQGEQVTVVKIDGMVIVEVAEETVLTVPSERFIFAAREQEA